MERAMGIGTIESAVQRLHRAVDNQGNQLCCAKAAKIVI